MNQSNLDIFLDKLLRKYVMFSPVKKGGKVMVEEIAATKEIDWSGEIPELGFKKIFIPDGEELALYKNGKIKEITLKQKKTVVFGMNILDLTAYGLYEQVFAKDAYYLKRKKNIFVIGYSTGLEDDYRKYKLHQEKFEENILEHRKFDVFIERTKFSEFKVMSGSLRGQKLLEENGIKNYEHVEFVGFVPEEGPAKSIEILRGMVENSFDNKIWDELNAKCIACGRCSMACPTCFCFDTIDEPGFDDVKKIRQWGSCFFNNFSRVAGDHEYLDTVKKKIFFWYFHKFVRIPEEFSYHGCVSCRRCAKVCPVGIDIGDVLKAVGDDKK